MVRIKDPTQKTLGEKIYHSLQSRDIEVLLDDRPERAGVKFKDADLIGIPWRVIIGRDAGLGKVELVKRSSREGKLLSSEDVIEELLQEIFTSRN